MKKLIALFWMLVLLNGCTGPVFETITDMQQNPIVSPPRQLTLMLPETAHCVFQPTDIQRQILYPGFLVVQEVVPGGDIERTIRQFSGQSIQQLTLLETKKADYRQLDTVFTSMGEGEQLLHRLRILDDGQYHYVLSIQVSAQENMAQRREIEAIFDSFALLPL